MEPLKEDILMAFRDPFSPSYILMVGLVYGFRPIGKGDFYSKDLDRLCYGPFILKAPKGDIDDANTGDTTSYGPSCKSIVFLEVPPTPREVF